MNGLEFSDALARTHAPLVQRGAVIAGSLGSDAGVVLRDGSGLDRGNRVTCEILVGTVEAAQDTIIESLPLAGVSGTLTDRMKTESLRGQVRAKTGTLNGVSALAGRATAHGTTLDFAMVLNDLDGISGVGIGDEVAEILVAYPDGPSADEIAP